jgi:hypothetical protein
MKTEVESVLRDMMTAAPDAVVTVRHAASGTSFDGLRTPLTAEHEIGARGHLQMIDGAVRVLVSALGTPAPAAGDRLEIVQSEVSGSESCVVVSVRYDQVRATVLIMYGPQYG